MYEVEYVRYEKRGFHPFFMYEKKSLLSLGPVLGYSVPYLQDVGSSLFKEQAGLS